MRKMALGLKYFDNASPVFGKSRPKVCPRQELRRLQKDCEASVYSLALLSPGGAGRFMNYCTMEMTGIITHGL